MAPSMSPAGADVGDRGVLCLAQRVAPRPSGQVGALDSPGRVAQLRAKGLNDGDDALVHLAHDFRHRAAKAGGPELVRLLDNQRCQPGHVAAAGLPPRAVLADGVEQLIGRDAGRLSGRLQVVEEPDRTVGI